MKSLFGSGRELSEDSAGSLTVIATVVDGAEDDGAAERAVVTTESSLIALDPELAAAGVFPALRVSDSRVSNEDELRDATSWTRSAACVHSWPIWIRPRRRSSCASASRARRRTPSCFESVTASALAAVREASP